jgi:hypothetical protein
MNEFSLMLKGDGVHMTRAQTEAITKYGIEHGGTIEVSSAGFGTVRVRDSEGRELLFRPHGNAERPG